MEKSEAMNINMKRKSSSVYSPRVKKFSHVEEAEVRGGERDICQNWGCSLSVHRKYEQRLAELEEKLEQAKEEADFYYWKSEDLESRLYRNLIRQLETAQNPPLSEESGENDSATSACCQSVRDKWMCRFCEEKEARCVVKPCNHLCLCYDCSFLTLSSEKDKCPLCGTRITDLFFINTS